MAARRKGPRTSIGLRLPDPLLEPLAETAGISGLSQNDFIVRLVAEQLGRPDLMPPIQEVLPEAG